MVIENNRSRSFLDSLVDLMKSNRIMPTIFCLIKFGKREHLEKLQRMGQMRFTSLESFRQTKEQQRGDELEGALEIVNGGFTEVNCEHPTLGTFNFKIDEQSETRFLKTDASPYCIFSCYALTYEMLNTADIYKIDERMAEFGDHALVIKNPRQFIDRVHEQLIIQNKSWKTNLTQYRDLTSAGNFRADLFTKSDKYIHQNEFRFLFESDNNSPQFIELGSIKDISEIHSSRNIISNAFKRVTKHG